MEYAALKEKGKESSSEDLRGVDACDGEETGPGEGALSYT